MSVDIERRERTAEEIGRDCRRDRIVDKWVSLRMSGHLVQHPDLWPLSTWNGFARSEAGQRRTDPPPDAELRAAVIIEIDKIESNLERRRRTA